jgi:hypothetical protein
VYPAPVYRQLMTTPDEIMWNAVESEPPVKVPR